jgi:hypothetical protein
MKNPKQAHFTRVMTISEKLAEFNRIFEYTSILMPKIIRENKMPLLIKTMEKRVLNKTKDIMPLIIRGTSK